MVEDIRRGQLVVPFGPGSLYTTRKGETLVICGLDHWYEQDGEDTDVKVSEYVIHEYRLERLLGVDELRIPADYRRVNRGGAAPVNNALITPAHRFPRWYRTGSKGRLHRFNLRTRRLEPPEEGGFWRPVRFVAVCEHGHLNDFPWKRWAGCTCDSDAGLRLGDSGGADLSSIRVECVNCSNGNSLQGITFRPDGEGQQTALQKEGIHCEGGRPWLGDGAEEPGCNGRLVGALINQTNLWFANVMSALHLPDLDADINVVEVVRAIEQRVEPNILNHAKVYWKAKECQKAVIMVMGAVADYEEDLIQGALERMFDGHDLQQGDAGGVQGESELHRFRRAEFDAIREPLDDPQRAEHLKISGTTVPDVLSGWLQKVNLVEKLRETRAFFGFSRLEPEKDVLQGLPERAMNQLFRIPPGQGKRWLPAIQVYGEGIYIELSEDAIHAWQENRQDWIQNRLTDEFIRRLGDAHGVMSPGQGMDWKWASRYLLVHSLAHVLINQMVFESGYSTASLRERLFVSADQEAPMAGLLIYTAAGDSEGTLGGLVRMGRPERLGPLFIRALNHASWCSADPVCSENLGGTGARLANLAACHACILLPETSCETINDGLDRAMLVGTPDNRGQGFMSGLLEQSMQLEES